MRRVPSDSVVASGASARHGPLSTCTPQKTAHSGCEFTFYKPGPPDPQGAWCASRCNLCFLLMCNANKPQQQMDEMVNQESRLKSERKNGRALSGGEVMYSQSGIEPTSSLNERPRRGNLRERGGCIMTIICHTCGKTG